MLGFYICDTDEDMARLMAQLYYIEEGYRLDTGRLKRMLNRHDVAGYDHCGVRTSTTANPLALALSA